MPEENDIPEHAPDKEPITVQELQDSSDNQKETQPEHMEVHHHPDLHHKKKPWKEYFIEFIMIFLAVTLGFFAETIREKISESHRESDYIIGLINNVKTDTSKLHALIIANEEESRGIDSLLSVSKNNLSINAVQDSIFYYAMEHTINLHIFTFNDLTLVQLRNAGGYSLIKTGKVADSIALYEYINNNIILQERFYTESYLQTWTSLKEVFDATVTRRFFEQFDRTNKIPTEFSVLITKNEEKFHLLLNNYWTFGNTLAGYNDMLKKQLEYLRGFISFLKRNYNMD